MLLLLELESKVFFSLHNPRFTILSDKKLIIGVEFREDHHFSFSTDERLLSRIENSPISMYFESDIERFGYARLFRMAGIKSAMLDNHAWKPFR